MNDQKGALAICSEFADNYGIDVHDGETIVVFLKSKYINELKAMLENKNYKIFSFQVYGGDALVNFIPNKKDFNI